MSEATFSVGHDGTRFVLTSNIDGAVKTARLSAGTHTNTDHDTATNQLRQDYATIRQWALDAAATNTNWPTMTATQKDNATREVIRRLGVFLDHFADLLVTLNADE